MIPQEMSLLIPVVGVRYHSLSVAFLVEISLLGDKNQLHYQHCFVFKGIHRSPETSLLQAFQVFSACPSHSRIKQLAFLQIGGDIGKFRVMSLVTDRPKVNTDVRRRFHRIRVDID